MDSIITFVIEKPAKATKFCYFVTRLLPAYVYVAGFLLNISKLYYYI